MTGLVEVGGLEPRLALKKRQILKVGEGNMGDGVQA